MSPLSDISLYMNGVCGQLAETVWRECDDRERRFILWDAPFAARRELFAKVLGASDCAGIAWNKGKPVACAWVNCHAAGGRSGALHFVFMKAARCGAMDTGMRFLNLLKSETGLICLTALVPVPFRATRRFAEGLGFISLGVIPDACGLPGRVCGGELFRLDFK